jgi:hypothetical protein
MQIVFDSSECFDLILNIIQLLNSNLLVLLKAKNKVGMVKKCECIVL